MKFAHVCRCLAFAFSMSFGYVAASEACTPNNPATAYPQTAAGLTAWTSSHRIALSDASRDEILTEFCTAAEAVQSDRGLQAAVVDAAGAEVVRDYLDRMRDRSVEVRTISAILRTHFGTGGLSRPARRKYGMVNISYAHSVDAIEIGGRRFDPFPAMLVEEGRARLVGRSGGTVVCRSDLDVRASAELNVTC